MPRSNLKIGFVAIEDPHSPDSFSGMPFHMLNALRETVSEVVGLAPESLQGAPSRIAGKLSPRIARRIFTFDGSVKGIERLLPGLTYRQTLRKARTICAELRPLIQRHRFDAVVGCTVTWPLFELELDCPLVHYMDATTHMVNSTYPTFISRSDGFKKACAHIERTVLGRADLVVAASEEVRRSAVEVFGVDESRSEIVFMGASVFPDEPIQDAGEAPSRDALMLSMIASSPDRKRPEFAVEVVRVLRNRSWNARLVLIGSAPRNLSDVDFIEFAGTLSLGNREDRERHKGILRSSHFMILPSIAEGTPIAPAEAAHFGTPSVVSNVGGLPSVVRDGETGLVMPLDASPEDYADRITSLCERREAYAAMCSAALERARKHFTWERWGERMALLIERVVGEKATR